MIIILDISKNIFVQGLRLKEQAQLLLDQNEDLISEMIEKIRNSEELIERAQNQQAATAELLAELDEANEKANDAVKRGDRSNFAGSSRNVEKVERYLSIYTFTNEGNEFVFKIKKNFSCN